MSNDNSRAHARPLARERRLPTAIRSLINRAAHARAIEYEKAERERMVVMYKETGALPAPDVAGVPK